MANWRFRSARRNPVAASAAWRTPVRPSRSKRNHHPSWRGFSNDAIHRHLIMFARPCPRHGLDRAQRKLNGVGADASERRRVSWASPMCSYGSASYEGRAPRVDATNLTVIPIRSIRIERCACWRSTSRRCRARARTASCRAAAVYDQRAEYVAAPRHQFRDVRSARLPAAAVHFTAAAKLDYEGKDYSPAATNSQAAFPRSRRCGFVGPIGAAHDLRELADGFLKLSEERLKALPPAAAVARRRSPQWRRTVGAVVAPRLYTSVDVGVQAPQALKQVMPRWMAPQQTQFLRKSRVRRPNRSGYRRTGKVERATLVKSIWPTYDPALLKAAKEWTYQPAQLNGKAVRYVKSLDITVNSSGQGQ